MRSARYDLGPAALHWSAAPAWLDPVRLARERMLSCAARAIPATLALAVWGKPAGPPSHHWMPQAVTVNLRSAT